MADSKPFEIRADILKLAKDILCENMHVRMEQLRRQYPDPMKMPPADFAYSTEQVIEEAEKLYAFVSKK